MAKSKVKKKVKGKKRTKVKKILRATKAAATRRRSSGHTATTVSLLASQKLIVQSKARKYAGGNLSLWLRVAGTNYVPKDPII